VIQIFVTVRKSWELKNASRNVVLNQSLRRCGADRNLKVDVFFVIRNIVSTLFMKRAIYRAEITIGTPKCPYRMARWLFR